jgi:hypothetical protein
MNVHADDARPGDVCTDKAPERREDRADVGSASKLLVAPAAAKHASLIAAGPDDQPVFDRVT